MSSFTFEIHVDAPIEATFDAFTDLRNAPDRLEQIVDLEVITDGPVGAGTRFRETRVMFGKSCTEEMEVSAFSAPSSYTVSCDSCGCRYETRFDFASDGAGTQVRATMITTPLSLGAKITAPVMGLVFGKSMRKCFEKDLTQLKAFLEAAGTPVPAT